MTEPQQTDLVTEAREYADGQLLIPTAAELDRMRELLRQLTDEVERLSLHLDDTAQLAAKAGENVDRLDKENTALREQLAEARAHVKAQDERIVNQRDEIKERVRLQADAERTVQAYRDALGVEPHRIDGLRIIEEMKSRLAQVEKERNAARKALLPFAKAASDYEPPKGKSYRDEEHVSLSLTAGNLRQARREALEQL